MVSLTDDILYMICTELWHRRDLNTLSNCACSGKQLATIAMMNLYRLQYVAPVTYNGWGRKMKLSQKHRALTKRAGLWRSIILSSLGKTLYPYSQYIRELDLEDLEDLLTADTELGAEIIKNFFQGEISQFRVVKDAALDVVETINRIGEAITTKTLLAKKVIGRIPNLSPWIPQLPQLTHLYLRDATGMKGNGNLVRLHCPSFKELLVGTCDSDQDLADFLNELRPQSLELFALFSDHTEIGYQSFQAINCHGETLVNLQLDKLPSSTISKVPLLKGCTNIISLSLSGLMSDKTDLEKLHSEAFLETLAWLKECKKLEDLVFVHYFSGPALMESICLENVMHITKIDHDGLIVPHIEKCLVDSGGDWDETCEESLWLMRDTRRFHQALANQTSLQMLWLSGDLDQHGLEAGFLVESLSNLLNLTSLCLEDISSNFTESHILLLAGSLPKLKTWSTRADELTDAIWEEVASLKSLRRLNLATSTSFTARGILDFIGKLGPSNKGFFLSVTDEFSEISWGDVGLIRKTIAMKVKGRYKLRRSPDYIPFERFDEFC